MQDSEQAKSIEQTQSRFTRNLKRADSILRPFGRVLTTLGEQEKKEWIGYADEIVRMLIVFMHAILEDGLRELLRTKLSDCSAEVLDGIPLAGTRPGGQPRKFSLGELYTHRNKTVQC